MIQDKSNDRDMIELAQKDLNELVKKKHESELKVFCYLKMKMIKNAIVEIRRNRRPELSLCRFI